MVGKLLLVNQVLSAGPWSAGALDDPGEGADCLAVAHYASVRPYGSLEHLLEIVSCELRRRYEPVGAHNDNHVVGTL